LAGAQDLPQRASTAAYGSSRSIAPIDPEEKRRVSQDINVLALVKGSERYVFLYDDASRAEALRVLGRYASNPELSFSWYDAAVLSQKIRQTAQKASGTRRFQMPQLSDTDEMF
jgi:hypothetical protein